jgi:hypothetical protein
LDLLLRQLILHLLLLPFQVLKIMCFAKVAVFSLNLCLFDVIMETFGALYCHCQMIMDLLTLLKLMLDQAFEDHVLGKWCVS